MISTAWPALHDGDNSTNASVDDASTIRQADNNGIIRRAETTLEVINGQLGQIPDTRPARGARNNGHTNAFDLSEQHLLELCDEARIYLRERRTLEFHSPIVALLHRLLHEERSNPTISLSTITSTHVDRLLAELIKPENMQGTAQYSVLAEKLERKWSLRFRQKYFDIDQTRYESLPTKGLLKDVSFNARAKTDATRWRPKKLRGTLRQDHDAQLEVGT